MKRLFIISLFLLQCCGGRIALAQIPQRGVWVNAGHGAGHDSPGIVFHDRPEIPDRTLRIDTCRVILTVPDSAYVNLAIPDSVSNKIGWGKFESYGKSTIRFVTYKEYWQVNYYNPETVHSYQKYFDNNWKEVKIPVYFNWHLKQ
jgi:hypothetical protein